MSLLGFWSYVHADDDVDMGRVTQLARDIVGHYEAAKAEEIELFLDRDDLHWGDQWRDRIDSALSNVAFFIPVLTPRYFKRPECRRELQFFANKSQELNIRELILPILYINVPELHEDEPSDPLMRLVKEIQWEPWIPYRMTDRSSSDYRGGVDALALELVRRVESVERTDVVAAVESAEEAAESEEGGAGLIDRIAALEEAMPRWSETLKAMGTEIERIGDIMNDGNAAVQAGEKQGKGFAARLTVARRMADELGGPVEKIETLGQSFASDLAQIDTGVRTLIEHGAAQLAEDDEADDSDFCEFLNSIRTLSASSATGMASVEGMIQSIQPIEALSKDMRPPLRRLRNSLTAMVEAREITGAWVHLVDSVDIDCPPVADGSSAQEPDSRARGAAPRS